jgi:arylsulfatase A-like enzyme
MNSLTKGFLTGGLVLALLCSTAELGNAQGQSRKPNIIFLLTDDQRWDALGAAGNPIIQTPNLDKLAGKAILFQNMYVTTAICCVSRASILSGQYMSRHKIEDFAKDFSPEALDKTLPALLKKSGYNIGMIGKLGIGVKNQPDSIFDYWSCPREGQPAYELVSKSGKKIHHTDSVANDVDHFLGEFAGKKEPFFLSVNFKAPHELDGNPPTYPVQERYKDLYKGVAIPEPVTADPKYWNSFPDFFRTEKNIGRERWIPLLSTNELRQETVRNYYRLITGVDEVVGKIEARLKELKIDDNTIIVFMGDNGFSLGEHGLEGKWFGFEESIRVPLIIYSPGFKKKFRNLKSNSIALNIDIAPTILAFAGVTAPASMQGVDLLSVLDKKQPPRTEFFYEHTFLGSPKLPKVEGVVTQDYKYMIYTEHGYEELYNVAKDRHETSNLVSHEAHAKKLGELRQRYKELKKAVQ